MPYRALIAETTTKLLAPPSAIISTDDAGHLAKILIEEVIGKSAAWLITDRNLSLTNQQVEQLASWVTTLRAGTPWQYVLGWAPFDDLKIPVRAGVLIPRPETEEIVAHAATWLNELFMDAIKQGNQDVTQLKIIDICTGSGCIAIALKHRFPQIQVLATDYDELALSIATENIQKLSPEVMIKAHDALGTEPIAPNRSITLIISNPPYVLPTEAAQMQPNVLDHEPQIALFVPENDPLLFYRAIVAQAAQALIIGGSLWLECNERYTDQVQQLLVMAGFRKSQAIADYRGAMRLVWGEL